MWVAQGDDEVECLCVEVWVEDFPIRVVVAYGPQLADNIEKKQKFWEFIEKQADMAHNVVAGFIVQMDSNSHLGKGVITRMRKTTQGIEKSILDVYVTCEKVLPYITKMIIDERRQHTLTN